TRSSRSLPSLRPCCAKPTRAPPSTPGAASAHSSIASNPRNAPTTSSTPVMLQLNRIVLLEIRFRQGSRWLADRQGRGHLVVARRPAPFKQRQHLIGEIDNPIDQRWGLHLGVAQHPVGSERLPADVLRHRCALGRLEAAWRAAQSIIAGNRAPTRGE